MSEERAPYQGQAQVAEPEEPEAAYLRNQLRRISVLANQYELGEIQKIAQAALSRPRTNGAVIDRLRRKVGDLESALIDQEVLQKELDITRIGARERQREARAALNELHHVLKTVGGPLERAGRRLDLARAKLKKIAWGNGK